MTSEQNSFIYLGIFLQNVLEFQHMDFKHIKFFPLRLFKNCVYVYKGVHGNQRLMFSVFFHTSLLCLFACLFVSETEFLIEPGTCRHDQAV